MRHGARRREANAMRTLIPPPVIALLLAAAMWFVARTFPVGHVTLAWLAPLAMMLAGAGIALFIAGAWSFARVKTTINPVKPGNATRLITSGVFRYSRNPIYLADLLLLIAWALWLGNAIALVGPVAFAGWMNHFQIAAEEQALRQLFGEDYAAYCARVSRWF